MDKISREETKEKKKKRNVGFVGTIRHSIEEAKMKREAPLLDVVTFFIAFIFSRCHVVFGSHPLAISFIAVLPSRVWIAVLGAVSGALTLGKSGIIYSMICVIVVFLRIIVSGTSISDSEDKVYLKWFSEGLLLKMSAALIGGFIAAVYEVLLSGITATTTLFGLSMILLPPVIVFALCGLFDCDISFLSVFNSNTNVFSTKGKSEKEKFNLLFFRLSSLLLLFLISISFKEYELLGISISYIFAAAASLIVARRFGALYGSIVGFVSSFGLSSSLSVAFALAGIGAGGLFNLGLSYGIVGGGALSPLTCQVLADITGRTIETIDNTQSVGAMGAALTVAAGIRGVDVLELSCRLVKANHTYIPDPGNKEIYERNYQVFKRLYRDNAAAFRMLNS
jgi:hypothetical protein